MNDTLISIIVPVYNATVFLKQCLDSISMQTYRNIEVILVDDGSTDNSGELCDGYVQKDSRFKVIHKDNEGVSKARNCALAQAKGSFIGFVDSDDTIEPDMFEVLYNNLMECNADISICDLSQIEGASVKKWSNIQNKIIYNSEDGIKEVLLGRAFFGGPCNKLFRRSIINEIKFPEDIYYGEDKIFVIEAFLNAKKIVFDPQSKYNYFKRENSACNDFFSEKTFTLYIAQLRIAEQILNNCSSNVRKYVQTSTLLCDISLLEKLYYDKEKRDVYCEVLQKSIRENFSFEKIREIQNFQKISVFLARIHYKLFFAIIPLKELIKRVKNGE